METEPILVGVLSDTHGQGELTARAAELFAASGVVRVFHCGDIGDESVVDALSGLEVTYVFGNTDHHRRTPLRRYIRAVGATVAEPYARCELAGRQIAAIHGDDGRTLSRLIDGQELDYLFHGHTHVVRSERIGRTHVINPGALRRGPAAMVAILDIVADRLRIVPLREDRAAR